MLSCSRHINGQISVATPGLLRAFGIDPSSVPTDVDVLSSRPGLSGSGVQLTYGGESAKGIGQLVGPGQRGGGPPGQGGMNTCSPGQCISHPVVEEESRLPTGTDAPNTVITEGARHRLHPATQSTLDGWIVQANGPVTSAQIINAQALVATDNLSVESKNDAPTSLEIVNWATVFAIVLAMSIGLIRSETASELRTLTATGANSRTRRTLVAATGGRLAFLGALLGTVAAYVGLAGWFCSNSLEGGLSSIVDHIPWNNLFVIVIAMLAVAIVVGWVLAGRDPTTISSRPMEWEHCDLTDHGMIGCAGSSVDHIASKTARGVGAWTTYRAIRWSALCTAMTWAVDAVGRFSTPLMSPGRLRCDRLDANRLGADRRPEPGWAELNRIGG